MINKNVTKLIGLKKELFDEFVLSGQIQLQPARLIPILKTGDEMALTSIFLSTLKLVKEFRDTFFKEIKLSRSGKIYFFTEATFNDLSKSRIDGLIIVVTKGKITDAVFLEMKNGNNCIDQEQIEGYLDLAKKLKIDKLVTVSNEFVADSSHSPLKIKVPKSISLLHFSWTYLITIGQLLLFKNETNIEDKDQVEIMKEVLYYFENPSSGIRGHNKMKPGWKELAENIHAQKSLKTNDDYIEDAVISWYQEEKNMSLLLSRKLGVLVKPFSKSKDSVKEDIRKIVKDNIIIGGVSVKNAVSDIKMKLEFDKRVVSMAIKITPPLNKGNIAKTTWIAKQLENCKRKSENLFTKHSKDIWLEANIKFAKENIKIRISNLTELSELVKDRNDIQAFQIVIIKSFGANFTSTKKFIDLIEQMVLDYYECIVQHMTNWKKPAPKIVEVKREVFQSSIPVVVRNEEMGKIEEVGDWGEEE
jgi:hypothetical protein